MLNISFDSLSEVNGPVAIITIPSSAISCSSLLISLSIKTSSILFTVCFPTSFLIISIFFIFSNSSVTLLEKTSLSTASACPAGTAVSSAIFIKSESSILNSSFNRPQALVCKFDLNELLHTTSAKFWLLCAGEYFCGFISYSFTFIPLLAIW